MRKPIVSFTLSEGIIKELNKKSKALGMSRSQFVEIMLKESVNFSEDEETTIDKISEMQTKVENKLQERDSARKS